MKPRIDKMVLGAEAMEFEPPSAERDRRRRIAAGRIRAQVRTV